MKQILLALAVFVCCASSTVASMAQGGAVPPADSMSGALSSTEHQMMMLVNSMPADKYTFAPSAAIFVPSQKTSYEGVRTFGALVIHVAQANYGMAARFSGLKPEVDASSLAGLKNKAEIDAALAASFAFVHKAISTLTVDNAFQSVAGTNSRIALVAGNLAHTSDEFGQMVEYARMNGITPPPSAPPAPTKK